MSIILVSKYSQFCGWGSGWKEDRCLLTHGRRPGEDQVNTPTSTMATLQLGTHHTCFNKGHSLNSVIQKVSMFYIKFTKLLL